VIAALAAHAEKKEPVALDALAASSGGLLRRMPEHPQTIGYALTDTPVGLAAWMLDHDEDSYKKISHAFLEGHVTGGLTPERVVDNITLHWLTNTAASSARLYWENFRAIFAALAAGKKPANFSLPVAFTVFPSEIFQAPRSWAEKVYPNLTPGSARQHRRVAADQFWRPTGFWRTTHIFGERQEPCGGHPDLITRDMRVRAT